MTTTSLPAAEKPPGKDALRLANGDLLYGKLLTIDPASGVRWQHPDARRVIEWNYDAVSEIQLAELAAPHAELPQNCFVRLRNDDELEGSLISCNAEVLVLDTSFGGKLTLSRSAVQSISPIPPPPAVVFGSLTNLDGWTIGKVNAGGTEAGEWKFKNGALYANKAASVARDLKLPDVASVHFDVAWKGNLYIAIALYTDYLQPVNLQNKENEPDFGGFYSLQLNSYYARLLPVKQHETLRDLGQVSVPTLTQRKSTHVEIRAHKSKRVVALLLDGALVKQWLDPEPFAGRGTGLRIVHQGLGVVKLDGLRITEWDGHFDEADGNVVSGVEDVARLRNDDKMTGRLEQVQDGKVFFVSGDKKTELPLQRVARLELARPKNEPPRAAATPAVRASLRGRGHVTVELLRWSEQGVEVNGRDFGRAVLLPSAISRLEFQRERGPGREANRQF
ncbi:MAG: hypothetical protein HY043_08780 [Verrucomicrobia bacterium]|nr:hypothetical protein [Verrucomicrobiota bacterium]